MGSGTYAYASLRLQMGSTSDYSAVDIAANPTSDAGIFLPQVPPSSYEEWWSFLASNIPPDSLCPEVSAEEYFAGLRPSIQCALIRSVDTAGTPHPENLITAINNEGFPVVCLSDSMCRTVAPWFPQSTLPETEGSSPDSAIFATPNFSIPSMPQDVSCTPTAVQYQAESTSRDKPQQLNKTGIGAENASSQPSQRPTDEGEAPKGPYPAMHDPSSCSYCDFKWSRPYQYRAHIKKKHRDVIPDVALNEAMWARRRAAKNARCIQQQPVLTLTPDPGRRMGTETWWGPLTSPPSEVVRATPAHQPAISHVDYGPQPESVELGEHKREDASESELRTALSSTEERAQRAMDLDMSARGVQIWFRDEMQSPYQSGCTGPDSPSALVPVPVPSPATPRSGYGDSQVVGSHRVQPHGPTYSYPAPLPTTMRSRETCTALRGKPRANTDPAGTSPSPLGDIRP
ncbi:hypothetical protein BJV77DRAFT_1067588 [Russula vinacea]|nr:hypothetical protein BJV77DRAFT_1067588 [Russula vinacea]